MASLTKVDKVAIVAPITKAVAHKATTKAADAMADKISHKITRFNRAITIVR